LQQTNAFSETRVYDSRSLVNSVRRAFPTRHREVNINFRNNVLNGSQSSSVTSVEDTRTSAYAFAKGGAPYGLLRFDTGNDANSKFKTLWGIGQAGGTSGGLHEPFLNRMAVSMPSTRRSNVIEPWKYRPEYDSAYQEGIYFSFLEDRNKLIVTAANRDAKIFYNDDKFLSSTDNSSPRNPKDFHVYTPGRTETSYGQDDDSNYYAPKGVLKNPGETGPSTLIVDRYASMLRAIQSYVDVAPQRRKSAEGYENNPDKGINNLTDYNSIPKGKNPDSLEFVDASTITDGPFIEYLGNQGVVNELTIDNRGFAKASKVREETGTPDDYNLLSPYDEDSGNKDRLLLSQGSNQSRDLIFFYFYDLINKKYIPFRATLGSIQDNNTGDWEDIKYMGRADKLYIYKGFSREVSFNFKVYANSIKELVPNWERVNYLVGLTRPSKYTDRAIATAGPDAGFETDSTGLESGFIYPPMIEFRIGDLYVDQPAVLRNVGVTVPDDAQWETLRDDKYTYVYGKEKIITEDGVRSRQLPNMIDVSIQLSIIEREQSKTGNYNFGPRAGWVVL
jgi:hypothetical protein